MEERSTPVPSAPADKTPGQGTQTGVVAPGRADPPVPVDSSGARPTFPGRRERTRSRLARLNDGDDEAGTPGKSFAEIADYIEANL